MQFRPPTGEFDAYRSNSLSRLNPNISKVTLLTSLSGKAERSTEENELESHPPKVSTVGRNRRLKRRCVTTRFVCVNCRELFNGSHRNGNDSGGVFHISIDLFAKRKVEELLRYL